VKRRGGSKRKGRAGRDLREVRKPSRAAELARNLALLVATLLLFGLVAEGALRVMVGTESNWFGDTAATDEYYLRVRRNSWGFRDVEHDRAKKEGVTRIAMVGDSFVFGVPIEDDEKIFPRLLQKKLGERYELISVAFPGANTAQEIRLLAQADGVYGFDHAILFFFPNDVEREGDPRGLSFYGHLIPGEAGKLLFSHSRFYYFLETRTRRLQERLGVRASYEDHLRSLYREGSPDLAAHRKLLGEFLQGVGGRVTVVIIPVLHELDNYPFAMAHDYVKGLARANGVNVIDLLDAFRGMDARDLVVNPYDFHFNEKAHAIVADYLRDALEKQGLH
jgi:hypothetical protein